jgi:hypothetical protein
MTEPGNRHDQARLDRDPHASPKRADQQDTPEPERPTTPAEDAGQAIQDLDEPPQAEGDR